MPLQNLFGDMSMEATQQEMLDHMTLLLAAILEKLPRIDTANRVMVSHAESSPTVYIAGAQTLSNLTTAADLNRLNAFGTAGVTSKPADAIPLHTSNFGAMHIYDNIKVS
jgi:hypothetical protein